MDIWRSVNWIWGLIRRFGSGDGSVKPKRIQITLKTAVTVLDSRTGGIKRSLCLNRISVLPYFTGNGNMAAIEVSVQDRHWIQYQFPQFPRSYDYFTEKTSSVQTQWTPEDIRALWRSGLSVRVPSVKNYKWRLNQVWHRRMLYSCTHMATVGVKG